MGAEAFYDRAVGRNAKEAFADVVDDARYEYGHGGYSGSIAEKSTFRMIRKSVLSVKEAYRLAEELIFNDDPRVDDKWGPAGCIEMESSVEGQRSFLFFGWASS